MRRRAWIAALLAMALLLTAALPALAEEAPDGADAAMEDMEAEPDEEPEEMPEEEEGEEPVLPMTIEIDPAVDALAGAPAEADSLDKLLAWIRSEGETVFCSVSAPGISIELTGGSGEGWKLCVYALPSELSDESKAMLFEGWHRNATYIEHDFANGGCMLPTEVVTVQADADEPIVAILTDGDEACAWCAVLAPSQDGAEALELRMTASDAE